MRGPDDAGFSLVEAVVAFGLAALALTGVLRAYASASASTERAVALLGAVEIAEERLEALRAEPALATTAEARGEARGLHWSVVAGPAPVQPATPGARRLVKLTAVVRRAPGEPPLLEVSTLRALPAAAPASPP